MDAWLPEKLKLMMIGGNGRAKAFFKAKGIEALPIREKYATDAALMYKDMLLAEAEGRAFSEAEWKPPERRQTYVSPAQNAARPEPGFGGTKYGGIGAPAGAAKPGDSWADTTATFAKGWTSLSSALTDAASVAAAKAQEAARLASEQAQATMASSSVPAVSAKGIASSASAWGSSLGAWAKSMTGAPAEEDTFASALANLDIKKSGPYASISKEQMMGGASSSDPIPPPRSPVENGTVSSSPRVPPVDRASPPLDADTDDAPESPYPPQSPDSFTDAATAPRKKAGLGARPKGGGLGAKRVERKAE